VLISAFVALTLTPMLSSRLLKHHTSHGWLFRRTEPFFRGIDRAYVSSLAWFLKYRWLAVGVLGVTTVLIVMLLGQLRRELSPLEDRGRIWIRAIAPEGTSFDYMSNIMADITSIVTATVPEAHITLTQLPGLAGGGIGAVNNGHVRVFLVEKKDRKRTQAEIADALYTSLREVTGARIAVTQEPSIGERRGGSGVSAQLVIQTATLEALQEVLPKFLDEARQRPEFSFVDSDLKFNKPELQVSIERDKAQTLGVSAEDVARTLQAALSGQRFGYFLREGKQYEVIAQLTRDFRSRPADLGNLAVRSSSGEAVRLDNLTQLSERTAPPELYRYNRYVAATITGQLARGYTMGDGVEALRAIGKGILDDRFATELTGPSRDFVESSSSLGYVFALAMVLIYLVLAAQFESFRDPFVIMLTVPLALAGALFALWYFNQTLNVFSQIGLIMLVGLVTKNGILIVEFANQRRQLGGLDALAAVRDAAGARLRPILMTTLATILGIVPIALALGAGAESRASMGIAVIGGLIVGGALTLFVIPAVYVVVARRNKVVAQTMSINPTTTPHVLPVALNATQ
jgi:multidrug efflux pump subunit AcrB